MTAQKGEEKDVMGSTAGMSVCMEMMERMMSEEGAGCGCDPRAMMASTEGEVGSDETFVKMFSIMRSMFGVEDKSEQTESTPETSNMD